MCHKVLANTVTCLKHACIVHHLRNRLASIQCVSQFMLI